MSYKIHRPPAHLKNFDMPDKKELEKLKEGDYVEMMIGDSLDENVEILWAIVQKIDENGYVTAILDSEPYGRLPYVEGLKLDRGMPIGLHVTDITAIMPMEIARTLNLGGDRHLQSGQGIFRRRMGE